MKTIKFFIENKILFKINSKDEQIFENKFRDAIIKDFN